MIEVVLHRSNYSLDKYDVVYVRKIKIKKNCRERLI